MSIPSLLYRLLLPHGLCKVYVGRPLLFLDVLVRDTNVGSAYFLFVADLAAINPFQMPYSLMTGEKIFLKISDSKKYVTYNVKFKETVIETNDGSCENYPYKTHPKYVDCVEAELRGKIQPVLGCMIPWMTNHGRCTQPIARKPDQTELLSWLEETVVGSFGGIQYKSEKCPLPCTLLSAHSTYELTAAGSIEANTLELHIEKNVEVDRRGLPNWRLLKLNTQINSSV